MEHVQIKKDHGVQRSQLFLIESLLFKKVNFDRRIKVDFCKKKTEANCQEEVGNQHSFLPQSLLFLSHKYRNKTKITYEVVQSLGGLCVFEAFERVG